MTDTLPPGPTAPTHPYWDLYREAQAAAGSCYHRLRNLPQAGRTTPTNAELVAYCRGVLVRRPLAHCNREHQVAVWLRRMVVGPERWHRCWTRAVVEAGMDAARARELVESADRCTGMPDWEPE
jgi:hypothetical protein